MSRNVGGGRRLGSKNAVHVRLDAVRHREPTVNAEELRRLSEAATPGPWVPQSPSNGEERDWYLDTHAYEDGPEPVWAPSYPVSEADIVFLAEVVNLYRSNQLQVIERDRLARALAKYGEHQHEWVRNPIRRFENGAWRDAIEPEEGWDRMAVERLCPDEETGECWCGLTAIISALDSTTGDPE